MHLNIFVSKKCFLYCKGCYSFSRADSCQNITETDTIVDFLKYARSEGASTVTLCGGDPLMRPDILNLLKKVKNLGYLIYLDTVGTSIIRSIESAGKTLIEKIAAKELVKLVDKIGIPIDGSNNEIFKKFRQTNGDLISEEIAICNEINKYGGNICINTVAHKGNLEDAKKLTELINKLGYISKWQIFQYAPLGKYGALNRELFEITKEEFEQFKEDVLSTINDSDKVQFKDFNARNKIYMMIDTTGDAWIPIYDQKVFDNHSIEIEERKVIGNINNKEDWEKICKQLKEIRRF